MKKLSKIILVIGIIFLLISCSNLDGKHTYKPTDDKIYIALVYPKTGTNLQHGEQFHKAASLAQKYINQNGGISGKHLEFIEMNSENSPSQALTIAEDLVKRDDILCVIADSNNNCTESAAPIYEKAHMMQITPIASSDEFVISGQYQFSASPTRSFNTKFDVKNIIYDMGYKSVGIIYINSTWSGPSLDIFERTAEEYNIQIRIKEPISQGQTKFRSIIQRVRQTNPDCLYILADYDETIKLIQTIRIDQWNIPIVVTGSYITEQPENIIGTSLGEVISRRLSSLDIVMQEKENFIYEYRDVANYSDMEFGMQVYDTVMMVAHAAQKSAIDLTRENFRDSFIQLKNFNGLLGSISFDKIGMAQRPFYVTKHANSRWEIRNSWKDIEGYMKSR